MKKSFFLIVFFISFLNAQFIREPIFNEVTYVETYGDPKNEPIVFVHGLGNEASSIWMPTVEVLKSNYFIMIFDLPGFGKSDKSNQLYSPTRYAYFINTLIDNFISKPFHLVGHSMGASIALKYTSLYQERVKSLVLIDAAGILNKISYSSFLLKYKVKNSTLSGILSTLPGELDDFDMDFLLENRIIRKLIFKSNPNIIAAISLVEENFSSIPRKINVPTMIVWGEKDTTAPIRTAYVLNDLIKNSKLEIIPDARHVPMADSKERYLALLKSHLKKNNYEKKDIVYPSSKIVREINNENGMRIIGNFKKLIIRNSKNINIKNSIIEQLIVLNSEIKVINSKLNLDKKSSIKKSIFELTASQINSDIPIDIFDSEVDFAAVEINVKDKLFNNLNELGIHQKIVYSLCLLNGKNMHGVFNIK